MYSNSSNIKKSYFIIVILCLGKIIGATGQTLFNVNHGLNNILKSAGINHTINFASIFAALCTLFIVSVTRGPAIHRQFLSKLNSDNFLKIQNIYRKSGYYILVNSNIAAGLFSSVGAYLGTITIIEFISDFCKYPINTKEVIAAQIIAMLVSISSFSSYYSFNIHKAKINSIRLVTMNMRTIRFFLNKNVLKTIIVSFLNITSLPFIAYFLTKSALYKMPYLAIYLSNTNIKCIAAFSAITALIASLTTTVASVHEYFSEIRNPDHAESTFLSVFRYITYGTGIVDSSANGLGTFLGVITISHDIFDIVHNNLIIYLATGCALSSAVLIFTFSVRQGFNDVINWPSASRPRAPGRKNH